MTDLHNFSAFLPGFKGGTQGSTGPDEESPGHWTEGELEAGEQCTEDSKLMEG